jgi:membrane protease YdiL (CAAX protease family)
MFPYASNALTAEDIGNDNIIILQQAKVRKIYGNTPMNRHLKIDQPWTQLAVFLSLFGGALLVYSIVGSAMINALGISREALSGVNVDPSDKRTINLIKILQAVSSVITFLLPAYLFPRIVFAGRFNYFIGFRKADQPSMYLLSVIVIVFALPIVFWLGEINRMIPMPEKLAALEKGVGKQIELFLHHRTPLDLTVNLLLLALLPAFGEELCFRAVLQRIMIQITGKPIYGILVTSFLFSALHLQFEGFFPRMFLGIILGVLYWYSGSIWTSVLAHFTNNGVQVVAASYIPKMIDSNLEIPVLLVVSSSIGLAAILYYFRKESRQSFHRIYGPEDFGPDSPFLADR